jgi:hypothetical protein
MKSALALLRLVFLSCTAIGAESPIEVFDYRGLPSLYGGVLTEL